MAQKKKKRIRGILIILVSLAVVVSFLNFFLANRLERYLKKELIQRTSEATDGFYLLSYDDLSINMLSGELKIEGIKFTPDSSVFNQWEAIDSLPQTYVRAEVEVIDFKGINLIWRWNYRQLHFNTFEIQKPQIEVFDAYYSDRFKQKPKNTSSKTLHELIEPYIDVLTVKTLNLENASVDYTVENPITPIIYSMHDASFHAYGFNLDSLSSKSGKLLYSENFDFAINQPQVLIANNDFSLFTDSIRLSTKDSLIYIGNIQLKPQEDLWIKTSRKPTNYIDGRISKVEVSGIAFHRENSLNYLTAHSFDIVSSDINMYNLKKNDPVDKTIKKDNSTIDVDSLVNSLSLYELISPVLRTVTIDSINLKKTKFSYQLAYKDSIESYHMHNFEFHAYDFKVDSLHEADSGFWYSRNLAFEATDMEAFLTARNHNLNVGRIALDTREGRFCIENIYLKPISTKTRRDYMFGKIDSLIIDGIQYNNGLIATLFKIDAPDIRYVSTPYDDPKTAPINKQANQRVDVDALLGSFLPYVAINDIRINRGRFTYTDEDFTDNIVYRLEHFNFFATDFRVESRTKIPENDKNELSSLPFNSLALPFTCESFGFHFSDFDNYLQDKNYRLSIKDAAFSTDDGKLRFEDVRLIPQTDTWEKAPETYFQFVSPLIIAEGIKNPLSEFRKNITIESFIMQSPDLEMVKPYQGKTLKGSLNDLILTDIFWGGQDSKRFKIAEIGIISPQFYSTDEMLSTIIAPTKQQSLVEEVSSLVEFFEIGKIYIDDLSFHTSKADSSMMDIAFKCFELRGAAWNLKKDNTAIHLNAVELIDPCFDIIPPNVKERRTTSMTSANEQRDIYDTFEDFASKVTLDTFQITNASIKPELINKAIKTSSLAFGALDLTAGGIMMDSRNRKYEIEDIRLKTSNISLPVDNGFFTLTADSFEISKTDLMLKNTYLKAAYPMLEFAIQHPKNADWFDVSTGKVTVSGIDLPYFFSNHTLKAKKATIDNLNLENYRNQQLYLPHRIVPFMYEGIQKAPLKMNIDEVEVNNMYVAYYELAKKGKVPGKIFFTEMNGTFYGFTNVATKPDQFIRLEANARLMGNGYFDATWLLPVDTLYDRFVINAHLPAYDLTTLNHLITPLANASIRNGTVNDLKFTFDANTKGAHIDMLFLYNDLKVDILKEKDGELIPNKFVSRLIDLIVRDNNPRSKYGNPRHVDIEIVRDPYHSIFNYIWQMLRPSLAESAGIPKKNQDFFAGVAHFFIKVKNFFAPGKKRAAEEKREEERLQYEQQIMDYYGPEELQKMK